MALLGKAEGMRPLGKPRRRWEGNIKMELEVGWGCMDRTDTDQDRDTAGCCISGDEPSGSIKFG